MLARRQDGDEKAGVETPRHGQRCDPALPTQERGEVQQPTLGVHQPLEPAAFGAVGGTKGTSGRVIPARRRPAVRQQRLRLFEGFAYGRHRIRQNVEATRLPQAVVNGLSRQIDPLEPEPRIVVARIDQPARKDEAARHEPARAAAAQQMDLETARGFPEQDQGRGRHRHRWTFCDGHRPPPQAGVRTWMPTFFTSP